MTVIRNIFGKLDASSRVEVARIVERSCAFRRFGAEEQRLDDLAVGSAVNDEARDLKLALRA